jgi:hypothetical protein
LSRALCPGRRPRATLAIAASLCVLAGSSPARADVDEDEIASLIARNRSAEALPIALDRARRRFEERPWREVRKLAGWNSATEIELEALEHLVILLPNDAEVRFALAQRLLWGKRTADALPHVRWLVARPEERGPAVLEVCFWVASAEGERALARETAERWLSVATSDEQRIRARWGIADLDHWSVRWREAREQYLALGSMETQSARAGDRLELLRHEHPTDARLELGAVLDNFANAYRYTAVASEVQLPARLVLHTRTEEGDWSRRDASDVQITSNYLRVRVEAWEPVRPEAVIGLEGDTAGNRAGFGSVGARLAIAGHVFGRVAFEHDRLRVGVEAIRKDVRAYGPVYVLYGELTPNLFISSEGQFSIITDDNVRVRTVNAAGAHTTKYPQFEFRVFGGYDDFRHARINANPYYTPTDPWVGGWDVTARARLRLHKQETTISPDVTLGFVLGAGTIAVRPSGGVRADVGDNLHFALTGTVAGTPVYWQTRADATAGYLF